MPDVDKLEMPMNADTVIYASDGTTVLADLHGPGYQHYEESLAAMGTLLPPGHHRHRRSQLLLRTRG